MSPRKPSSPQPSTVTTVTRLRTATKLFVLDSNVLMHDPTSLFRFQEHDVYIPMVTLEELDHNKKGMSEVARNARQTSRFLDEIVSSAIADIDEGISLQPHGTKNATGRLFLQTQAISSVLPMRLASGSADNQIIGVVKFLQETYPNRTVALVSKDINMRIKARALDWRQRITSTTRSSRTPIVLFSGMQELPADFWDNHGKDMESWQQRR